VQLESGSIFNFPEENINGGAGSAPAQQSAQPNSEGPKEPTGPLLDEHGNFRTRQLVQLHGLQGAVELNGRSGILKSFDIDSGRWIVDISECGEKKVKVEHIRLQPGTGAQCTRDFWRDKWLSEFDQKHRCSEMSLSSRQRRVKKTLEEIKLKNGQPALTLFGDHTHLYINPSGKFIIGGPQGDAGLTGRKIIIDTYGGWGAHGGGAFSGKDPTKVDRSAAYVCRQMAKSVVKSGLCKRALVQLSYAIGVAKPLSLFVETYGTEQGKLNAEDITNIIKIAFDCRPGAIAMSLALREPKYQETAAYCHFGREPYTKDGIKFFEWENAKDLTKFKSMTSEQVASELKGSNYLTKWVD